MIPAYQEERLLPVTLAGIPSIVKSVIIVDDASTDATRKRALAYAAEMGEVNLTVQVLTLPDNAGVGRAICVGYLAAAGLKADVAVVMGADAQMDPAELIRLVDALSDEVIYVKGERMTHPEVRQRMPAIRYWGNRVLSIITGRLIDKLSLRDAQCGYTALNLHWLSSLPLAELYPRYGFPNDVLIRIYEAGGRIAQVPVTPIYDTEVSKLSIPRVIFPLMGVFIRTVARRFNPRRRHRTLRKRETDTHE